LRRLQMVEVDWLVIKGTCIDLIRMILRVPDKTTLWYRSRREQVLSGEPGVWKAWTWNRNNFRKEHDPIGTREGS
jgi:hypothetical protein